VLCDVTTLHTLDARQFRAGLAEVIKHALIADAAFFAWLEAQPARAAPATSRRRSRKRSSAPARSRRASSLSTSARRAGSARSSILGHTFGHAIEAATGFEEWLHGEAVAAGIVLAARFSQRCRMLDAASQERIVALLSRAGLPVAPPPIGAERLASLMKLDKKVRAGQLNLVLLERIGAAIATRGLHAGGLARCASLTVP
jgi:3-dehydroquinate synthase